MSEQQKILTERKGHILIITINRREARNAFDMETAQDMEAAMDRLDDEDDLFVGIITGGGGNFSAGMDLKAAARRESATTEKRGGFGLFNVPSRKPLIAAVEGFAVGGGFELCLACDLIVASKSAKLGLPEVKLNLIATGGGLFRLPRRMPYHVAMELALSGDLKDPEFFRGFGIVNRVCEQGKALESAIAWAEKLIENGPLALAAAKQIMFNSANWTEEEAWKRQFDYTKRVVKSEDHKEGLAAFAQKRKPVWKGR